MNNENKELFYNDVETNISEENIILAPPAELFAEAKEIAQNTHSDEKFPFALQYDSNQKEFLLSMLETVAAIVENDDDICHVLATMMNMTQLAFIKQLGCVERVRTDEGINPFLAGEAVKLTPIQQEQQEDEALDDEVQVIATDIDPETFEAQTEIALNRPTNENLESIALTESNQTDDIAVASVTATARSSCCPCPTNVSLETAATISDEGYTSGYICCPGAEQWFKFVATRTGQYTIYTTGNLDTVGTLYDCCGNQIIMVDDFAPCGKINFRIICNLTAGNTYYIKVGVLGNDTGNYTLRVTERVLANYVNINKTTITLIKGATYELPVTPNYTYKGYNGARRIPGLSVSINPTNANEQKIWWWEQYGSVLECSYGRDEDGDQYIHVTATEKGIAKLYAEDWNENGKRDECTVYVGGAPVTGISLDRSTKTVSLNDTEQLTTIISPQNALNKSVTWDSSNRNVVDVDSNGVITGLEVGTATVSATTNEGGFIASCLVTVDKRPKVMVERDEDYSSDDDNYFNITFSNGKIWRNIGCDLALDENRSGFPLWNKVDCYDSFTSPEQRYVDNIEQTFSAQELALIYRLDPLGVEYYMKNDACSDASLAEWLLFKDDVYKAIFGEPPSNSFYFTINDSGQMLYGSYSGWCRTDHYSIAETLFGSHVIFDWSNFWESIFQTLFNAIPGVSYIQTGIEIYQALFHAGSVWGLYTSQAISKAEEYVTAPLNNYVKEKLGEKAHKCIRWANNLISMLRDATLSAFVIPNLNDITIYDTVEEQDVYRVVFENHEGTLSLREIIDLCDS